MCNKKKLFKLLWLLDSEHYQAIGRPVTGYHYFAWKMGPVPTELHEAIDSNDAELTAHFDIERSVTNKGYAYITLHNNFPFDGKYFSRKEKEILASLKERFDIATGEEMENWTHRKGTAWYRVWVLENKKQAEIPYDYALDALKEDQKELVQSIAKERQDFLASYQ